MRVRAFVAGGLALIGLLLLFGILDGAHAQFGAPRPPAGQVPDTGIAGWIIAKQAEFYRALSGTIRAAKTDGSAVWTLLGLSFAYGIFHAAGPGHGKAVISSYLVANEETWRRGIALSFTSALLQAFTAVAVVGVATVLLGATAKTMNVAVNWIEIVSYALIALLGARLLWVKGRGFLAALRNLHHEPAAAAAPATAAAHAHHDHGHHDHSHHDHAGYEHHPEHSPGRHDAKPHVHGPNCGHDHDHEHASAWGHAHGPEPQELAGPGGWRRGLTAIIAVGLRPCSGAILVLVFALAQGLFWAGVAATFVMALGTAITVAIIATLAVGAKSLARKIAGGRSGYGMLAMRGVEVLASIVVLVFGVALLAGYMVSERMVGF
jgi:nickel/cobalt exporter